jgi:hypothetical protein
MLGGKGVRLCGVVWKQHRPEQRAAHVSTVHRQWNYGRISGSAYRPRVARLRRSRYGRRRLLRRATDFLGHTLVPRKVPSIRCGGRAASRQAASAAVTSELEHRIYFDHPASAWPSRPSQSQCQCPCPCSWPEEALRPRQAAGELLGDFRASRCDHSRFPCMFPLAPHPTFSCRYNNFPILSNTGAL